MGYKIILYFQFFYSNHLSGSNQSLLQKQKSLKIKINICFIHVSSLRERMFVYKQKTITIKKSIKHERYTKCIQEPKAQLLSILRIMSNFLSDNVM